MTAATPVRPTPDRNSLALAVLRVAVGGLFLIFGEYKIVGREFVFGGGFEGWIHRFIEGGAYPFMVPVLQGFVLSHSRSLALLVALGESAMGVALVTGVWARIASGFGVIYMLTLLFSSNYPGSDAPLWAYFGAALDHLVLAMCFGAFLLGSPATALSVPAWRTARRSPSPPGE
jgi:thiosulfate dehydrogenase [quinone] large subunit